MTRPDRGYEHFVQEVYQAILTAEGKDTVKVKHNVKLQGTSGQEHQIDVYWEYKQGGITYQTAIECKFYKDSIGIGKVRDFYGVLSDIPNLRGIVATARGYQSGALQFAKSKGIELQIIRSPEDADYDWLNLNLKLRGHVAKVLWHELSLVPDLDWCLGIGMRPEELRVTGEGGATKIYLEDRLTGRITTMGNLLDKLSASSQALTLGERYLQVFPDEGQIFNNTWLVLPNGSFPEPIKILQLSVPYIVQEGLWKVNLMRATEQDSTIIKDALKDEHTFYSSLGKSTGGKGRY
jgi:hypothetical protein